MPYGFIRRPYVYEFFEFFQGPTDIFKFDSFLYLMVVAKLKFLPNFQGPSFIPGPMFILFANFSRPYVFTLPYVYSGV